MAEGVAGKKEQQKNKKTKQNEKKKHQQNGLKNTKPVPAVNVGQKKKNKSNKHNLKSSDKKSKSFLRKVFTFLYPFALGFFITAGFLYIVDYEKFTQVKSRAGLMVNNIIALLPESVVATGGKVIEFIQPIAEVILGKLKIFINEISVFLNTNPVIKDHWINIREISSICGGRLTDYFRTLYLAVTGFCNKLFL